MSDDKKQKVPWALMPKAGSALVDAQEQLIREANENLTPEQQEELTERLRQWALGKYH